MGLTTSAVLHLCEPLHGLHHQHGQDHDHHHLQQVDVYGLLDGAVVTRMAG